MTESRNFNIEELKATNGKPITCKAAVAWEAKKPLDVTDVIVAPPKAGEVRLKIFANALCHTDIYTLEGHDPEGLFPSILGHEAAGVVESIGEGVTSVQVGDVVIPCYTPECKEAQCIYCQNPETNLCPKIRAFQGKGVMPDGTSRFSSPDGKTIYHFMGCSSFSEYTVVAEISVAKVNPNVDFNKICMLGCGVSTGWGAVHNTCKVKARSSVVVFGLGAVGLAVIQAAKSAGASKIVAVDINASKYPLAQELGATDFVNSAECENRDPKARLMEMSQWGYDYTFDCTGIVAVMRTALEVAHRGWGISCVIGVAAAGHELSTRPFQLVTGRSWKGTAFGGWKSRTDVPILVNRVMSGELKIDQYLTHTIEGLPNVNDAIHALHSGECIRAVVEIHKAPESKPVQLKEISSEKTCGGHLKRFTHWSEACQCEMTFALYLPEDRDRKKPFPLLTFLSGLTCTDVNASTKSGFQKSAAKHKLAVVFPDTSPRVDIEGDDEVFWFGKAASYYLNATEEKWKKHYNMYDYITKELPTLLDLHFNIDVNNHSITGHSMGGHGALMCHFKNPGMYKSVSAFAPIGNLSKSIWGAKCFPEYLGSMEAGENWDPTFLVKKYEGPKVKILVDQGTHDIALVNAEKLVPQGFIDACNEVGYPLDYRYREGYSHGYFFVSTFIDDHIEHHARYLNADN